MSGPDPSGRLLMLSDYPIPKTRESPDHDGMAPRHRYLHVSAADCRQRRTSQFARYDANGQSERKRQDYRAY